MRWILEREFLSPEGLLLLLLLLLLYFILFYFTFTKKHLYFQILNKLYALSESLRHVTHLKFSLTASLDHNFPRKPSTK
jgi:hypothetical protein